MMRLLSKRERLELISMISGDADSIKLGHLMCRNYIALRPDDSKFKQKYRSFIHRQKKKLKKITSKWISWKGLTTSNHLSSSLGMHINNRVTINTLINI